MPLAHFTNTETAVKKYEPVYKSLFEVIILLPPALTNVHPNSKSLLLENAIKVTLPTYPPIQTQTQRFKYSTRLYPMLPETTSLTDVGISFNMNQNYNNQVFTWRMLKDWYDLVWNNENGELNYKRDLCGDIIVNIHDKDGIVIRRVTYNNCMLLSFTGWQEADWGAVTEIESLETKFAVDYWNDWYY
jgi:hypothetical protein